PALAALALSDMRNRDPGTLKRADPRHTMNDPAEWTHFAVVRDGANKIRWLVNGLDDELARPATFSGELRYDKIGVLWTFDGQTVIDFDELCLFDRALTEDELGALTGRKAPPPPKVEVVEIKLPPPGMVPAAGTIAGLKFYLACDKIDDLA